MGVPVAQGDVAPVDADGFVGRIPVRNLWLLMLYASDFFRTSGVSNVGVDELSDIGFWIGAWWPADTTS